METITRRHIWVFFGILIAVMIAAYIFSVVSSPGPQSKYLNQNYNEVSDYFTIYGPSGQVLLQTGLPVQVNDEYIHEDNKHYVVTSIKGREVRAVLKDSSQSPGGAVIQSDMTTFPGFTKAIPAQADNQPHVVIYHTHTDESYWPTSRTDSKPGKGDVYEVGAALTDTLQKHGFSVSHSYNAHDPHDINAYNRSRRTAVQLIKENPDAIFDIHRDAAPASSYQTSINGIPTARVMIVIGRSNPNMAANLEYARKVKEVSDRLHPGLMRGIFMGRGDYNQDLSPRALLFEVGTNGNYQLSAERAVRALGDVLIAVLEE